MMILNNKAIPNKNKPQLAIYKQTCILLVCLLGLSISGRSQTQKVSKEKPNVLIIYPDQLRRYSAGFWSEKKYAKHVIGKPDPVVTPNMDRLAKNGVVFTKAISNFPLCSPARGMLLSGMYPEQNGIWNNCNNKRKESLRDDIPTITDLFYEAGYNTAYIGKCHWLRNDPLFDENGTYIGSKEAPGGHYINKYDTYIPPGKSRHSIEYFYQAIKDVHFDPMVYSNDANAIEGKKDGEMHRPKIFSAKNEAEKIIDYLQNKNAQRDSSKPFCMIWSLNPPHNPWDEKNTDMEMLRKHYDTDKYPEIDRSLVVRDNADFEAGDHARNYFANVTSIDKYIGDVLNELKKLNQFDNTIIVVSSDHGEMLGSHGKKGKNIIETEAMAVPFIVHWPNKVKAGGINDILLSVPDVLPTIMGLSGLEKNIPTAVEGSNFSETLTKPCKNNIVKPEGILLMLGYSRGVLTDRYTLCLQENKKTPTQKKGTLLVNKFIYDNLNDPYQLKRIPLNDMPEIADQLLKILGKKLKEANDPWYKKRKFNDLIPY